MAYTLADLKISGTTPASASTAAVGSEVTDLGRFSDIQITADLVGATGGALDVYLQRFDQSINKWIDWVHFPQLAAAASAIRYTVSAAQKASASISVVGVDLTPALAANAATGGHPGNKVRVVAVAGASTSAGAAIVISIRGRS